MGKQGHQNLPSGGSDGGSTVSPLPSIETQKHRKVGMQPKKESIKGPGVGRNSMIRGQFDQTLRTMKDGQRATHKRLSKIFLDS